MSTLEVERDPYTDGTLVLGDKGSSIRTNNGTQNNLNKPSLGAANTPFIRLDLRNALFPAVGVGFDLYAADIQRGRDRGVADYNQVRVSLGLPRVTSFNQITSDSKLAETLQNLYHTLDDVDLLVGLLAEKPVAPSGVGETSQKILVQQYQHLRDSDRFWFERPKSEGGFFTSEEIADIKQVSFADIIKLNTEITDIPENPFKGCISNQPHSKRSAGLNPLFGTRASSGGSH